MKNISKITMLFVVFITFLSCKQQQARMPVSRSSGTFMKESAARNKKLVAGEEGKIDSIIKSNPKVQYIASKKGYWYHYVVKNENDTLRPKKGDVAQFDYEIMDMKGNVVYSEVELRPQTYIVDKQNIMMGLRDGIKLMHKKEQVTFLFPSHMAFGYRGDTKRIKTNQPIIVTVTLNDFKAEAKATAKPVTPTETKPKTEPKLD
ncbi:gliding motility-associated peptidyl-prolyl isomerase GldI [Flavobacterium wongokense]|uniref:gliding motility-associated peptidyl-prolyl isomerase GldI n=1 Tax=Flavobacterium wongokense TaxID=2910674 RepID=UPI001F2D355A|nr:gliding motility-associated peptidyl-prolyl isomerase GldI [Flavobacterium sp. WG47]MCF6132554.1 gliding motility-associated peptidyl-prolyl isomerase GldI [Flavobacterium sp. WG47]